MRCQHTMGDEDAENNIAYHGCGDWFQGWWGYQAVGAGGIA